MKTIILSLFASLLIAVSADAYGPVANFSALQGGTFVLTVNGELINRQPADHINLKHLRPGKNRVFIEYHRNGRVRNAEHMVFLENGFETSFNIRGTRAGVSITKVEERPLPGRGRRGGNVGPPPNRRKPLPPGRRDYHYRNGHHYNWYGYGFRDFMFTLRETRWGDEKYWMVRDYLDGRRINTKQLNRILNQFTWDDTKVDITVNAYYNLVDPENLWAVYHQFKFRSSIREVKRRLGLPGRGRPYYGY